LTDRPGSKRYDRAYFDGWYRDSAQSVGSRAALRRNVALAVAVTESILARPLRSVLDVGCGEGRWQPILHEMCPKAAYLGIDPSEYAVARFGTRRNLRLGTFEDLGVHTFDRPFDLVVCSDVLHYLAPEQIMRGIDSLVERVAGVALLEVFTAADEIEGDHVDFHPRPPEWYRGVFRRAGLTPVGLQMYVPDDIADELDVLDLPG
jgi:SAM-dependent methyltransferase